MICTCAKLNAANKEEGVIIMCDHCLAAEIRRLDRFYDDGRTGFICSACGAAAWEPQGGTVCADCAERRSA